MNDQTTDYETPSEAVVNETLRQRTVIISIGCHNIDLAEAETADSYSSQAVPSHVESVDVGSTPTDLSTDASETFARFDLQRIHQNLDETNRRQT